jgi:hypothetical protein
MMHGHTMHGHTMHGHKMHGHMMHGHTMHGHTNIKNPGIYFKRLSRPGAHGTVGCHGKKNPK